MSENYPPEPPAQQPYGQQPYGQQPYSRPPYEQQQAYPSQSREPVVHQPQPVYVPVMHGYAPPVVRPTSTMAVVALILGLLWGCGFLSVIGLILNLMSWKETSGGERGGHGIQVAGLVLNSLGTVVLVGWIAFWAVGLVVAASGQA